MTQLARGCCLVLGALSCAACSEGPLTPRAVQLAFIAEPTDATAGVAISPVIGVAIEDASGNTVTSATEVVTLSIGANHGPATLVGTTSVGAVNGIATFPTLRINRAGTGYTLTASADGLAGATSASFTIAPGPAAQLVFAVQPSATMGGAPITPPVQVVAQDSFGNLATAFSESVTVALGTTPGAATLSGTTVVKAVNGVAVFSDLSVAQVSTGYTLTATAGALRGATSAPFAIVKPTALLRITASTTGSLLDPDGYTACVDPASDGQGGTACAFGRTVDVNSTVTVTVDTGAHAVLLMGVAANCAVTGDNPRAVHATQGEMVEAPFHVGCQSPALHITAATTGVSLDPDGYYLCVDPYYDYYDSGCSTYAARIGVNSDVIVPVDSGDHVVELDDMAANCAVSGDNPRTVSASGTIGVTFTVTCYGLGSVRVTTATSGSDVDPDGYRVCIDRSGVPCYWWAQVRANDAYTFSGVFAGSHTVTLTNIGGNCGVSGGTARAVTVPTDATVDMAFDASCTLAERIAYATVYGQIHVVHSDGTADHSITGGSAPAWSPDGARVAYECGQNICAINGDGTGFAQLTTDGAGNRHPSWSPDGSKIAFAARPTGVADLYVMAASGSAAVRLTQNVGFLGSPAWSPAGTKIAFDCVVDTGNVDICVVNADGSGFTRLTSDPARDFGAAWKPDGSALAFTTTRTGGDEIVLLSPAGGSVARIGAGLFGIEPAWSPDGTQLTFVQPGDYEISDAIVVANADGSNVRYVVDGNQPAWKPHR